MRRPRTANALRGPPSSMCDVIRYGYFKQVCFLVSVGTNFECREPLTRRTPLMMCALMEPPEWGASIAMTLLEAGARAGSVDSRGHNVFHLACIWGRERLVRVLLRAIDFDLGRQDKDGNTALHLAAMSGDVSVTQLVAEAFRRYCVNLNKTNCRGMTACQEALRAGYTSCAHAINFALAGKRPGSAPKDVRFHASASQASTGCNHTSVDDRIRGNKDKMQFGENSGKTHFNKFTNNGNLTNSTNESYTNIERASSTLTEIASCQDENVARTENSSDSVFLDNVSPIQEVYKPTTSPRNRMDMRSPRPMTAAFLTRHDSHSTLISTEEKRSAISYPGRAVNRARKRKSMNPLYSYGYKKDTDIIQCAPENDFRNTSEFVCKISHLPPNLTPDGPLTDTIYCNGPWMGSRFSPDRDLNQSESTDGWRQEIKSIFKVYEHQYSSSWRNGRKLEVRPVTPDPSLQEELEKGRRGRRQSITSKIHGEKMPPTLARRQSVVQKPKRCTSTSSNLGRGADGCLDVSRDPSIERTTSPVPSNGVRRRSGHQLDSASGQGQRSGSTSPKGKMDPNIEEDTVHLPSLSEHCNKVTLPSSLRKQNAVNISKSKDVNNNVNPPLLENPKLQQTTENEGRKTGAKVDKGTGKYADEKSNSSTSGRDSKTKRNNSAKTRVDVPIVNEILVHDQPNMKTDLHYVDTNRLSVPVPYDDDDDQEESDYGDEI